MRPPLVARDSVGTDGEPESCGKPTARIKECPIAFTRGP
jgi:hypothetical protein